MNWAHHVTGNLLHFLAKLGLRKGPHNAVYLNVATSYMYVCIDGRWYQLGS